MHYEIVVHFFDLFILFDILFPNVFLNQLSCIFPNFRRTQFRFRLSPPDLTAAHPMRAPISAVIGIIQQQRLKIIHHMRKSCFRCFIRFKFFK